MATCIICRFETVLDDIELHRDATTCVCLRCYARQTNSARPMPKPLRKALAALLAEVEAHPTDSVRPRW